METIKERIDTILAIVANTRRLLLPGNRPARPKPSGRVRYHRPTGIRHIAHPAMVAVRRLPEVLK